MKFNSIFFFLTLALLSEISNSQVLIGNGIPGEAEDNHLGRRRTISFSENGNIIALGAPDNYENGTASGHVRVFENINNQWVQIGNDIDGQAANTGLGYSTALSNDGNILAVGAGNSLVFPYGLVRVYQNVNDDWQQIGDDLYGENPIGDNFGGTVSISADGTVLAIGDFKNNQNGNNSGHVRIFELINNNWIQIGTDIDGTEENEEFGRSVSISENGNIVAIGAPGLDLGLVRVYENNGESWSQMGSDIIGEVSGDSSGFDVSLSADGLTVAIGAHENNGNGINSGHVRVYQFNSGNWFQIGNDIDGEASSDFSGFSISLNANGDIVAIGAYGNDANGISSGQARVYKNNSGSWEQIGNDIDGENFGDTLGRCVAISDDGTTLACGVWASDVNGNASGQVLIYDLNGLLSTSDFYLNEISIYPNPIKNVLQVETNLELEDFKVYSASGQEISEFKFNKQSKSFNFSNLNSGVYIIKLKINGQSIIRKFIKE